MASSVGGLQPSDEGGPGGIVVVAVIDQRLASREPLAVEQLFTEFRIAMLSR
jgi:hypothetical protein